MLREEGSGSLAERWCLAEMAFDMGDTMPDVPAMLGHLRVDGLRASTKRDSPTPQGRRAGGDLVDPQPVAQVEPTEA
jgi:hypothetical protein